LSNETHMPKNLYQTSSENSYRKEASQSQRGHTLNGLFVV
jgi:hypothetical protein